MAQGNPLPVRGLLTDQTRVLVKFVGGTAAVTQVYGIGSTVTYVSTGIVDVVFPTGLGTFIGLAGSNFQATTASGVKGYTVVPGVISGTTLRLNITNASESLTDLAALQWLTIEAVFATV